MSYLQKYAYKITIFFLLLINPIISAAQNDSLRSNNIKNAILNDSLYLLISKPWIDNIINKINNRFTILNHLKKIESNNNFSSNKLQQNYDGLIIRSITIFVLDVFGPTIDDVKRQPSNFIEKIGNKIHIKTSEKIIKNNLLIKEGNIYNQKLIEESERILRTLSFIEDAKFIVYSYDTLTNQVDMILLVKDLWPYGAGMELTNVYEGNINIWNKNLFGYGREFYNNFSWNTLKSNNIGYEGTYILNNIGGSFTDARFNYTENYKIQSYFIDIERNFISYKIKYGWGLHYEKTKTYHDIIFPDTTWIEIPVKYNKTSLWTGRNFSINSKNNDYNKFITIILKANQNKYFERPQVAKDFLYAYHNKTQIINTLFYTKVSFQKDTFIYAFGKTEDVPKGLKIELTGGYEHNEFINRLYFKSAYSFANYLKFNNSYLFYLYLSFNFDGFIENKLIKQGNFYSEIEGFSKLFNLNHWLLRTYFQFKYQLGLNRYPEEFISIEDKNGIIGLKSNKLRGIQKFLIKNEYLFISPFHILGFRTALFFNWNLGIIGNEGIIFNHQYYSSISIGFRFRNENLTLNNIQLNFTFFPRIPADAIYKNIQASAGKINNFPDFYKLPYTEIGNFK